MRCSRVVSRTRRKASSASSAVDLWRSPAFCKLLMPFWLAVTLLGPGERLTARARASEAVPLFAEAHEIFDRVHARPWQERLAQVAKLESMYA